MADLSAFSVPYYRSGSRKFRIIFAVGLALLVAPAAGVVTSTPGLFSNLSSVIEMVLILAGFGSLSTLFPIVFSPGAVRLEVTRSGVLLGTETVASRITGETSRQLGSRSSSCQLRPRRQAVPTREERNHESEATDMPPWSAWAGR